MLRQKIVHAAIAVIKRRGRYLICRRPTGKAWAGYWEFPGGKRKPGESWEACLRREVREELGVGVKGVRPFGHIRHRYPSGPVRLAVYRCEIASGQPQALGSAALRWVRPVELARYRFPAADKSLLAALTANGGHADG